MHRPSSRWLIIAIVFFLSIGALSANAVFAQDDPEAQATIEALETQVSALQTQVADLESQLPSPTAEPEEARSDSSDSLYLAGPGLEFLPAGTAGEVEVVLAGTYDGSRLPIVIRNNTDEEISDITVSATVKSADGALIGAGGDLDIKPFAVEAGSYAIGYLYFDGIDLAPDVEFEYDIDYEEGVDLNFLYSIDLEVGDVAYLDGRLVGELINSSNEVAKGPFGISVACISPEGDLLDYWDGYSDKEEADPGESIPFQVEGYSGADCRNFVIAGSGFNF